MNYESVLLYFKTVQEMMDTRNALLLLAALYVLKGIGFNVAFLARWAWRLFLLFCFSFHIYWYYEYIPHSFKSAAAEMLRFFKSNKI
jgi:hypothetical protein